MTYEITLTRLIPQHAAVVSGEVAHEGIGQFLGQAFSQVMGTLSMEGLTPTGMPFARFDFAGDGFKVEAGFPTSSVAADNDGVHDIELPGGDAVTTLHVGAYTGVADAYTAIESWMSEHGYQPTGAPWESYLDGPDVAEPRTVVTWPCHKIN